MSTNDSRRQLCLAVILIALSRPAFSVAERPTIEVWKSPTCGCCQDWIAHLQQHGFTVNAHNTGNSGARQRLGMPMEYGSCHTASVGGYVIEGHVPAADIIRLLKDKPVAVGIAVPRMPIGSPGMDGPAYGGRKDPYEVLLVKRNGSASVFQSYP